MNKELDAGDLRALREIAREAPGGTFEDRKRLERNARLSRHPDARRNRPQRFMLQMNFDIEPDQKDEFVRYCQAHGIKIAEACREALKEWLDKREAQ